jgi:hypothetical protein
MLRGSRRGAEGRARRPDGLLEGRGGRQRGDPVPGLRPVRRRAKANELRHALDLPATVPIFVAAADPYGLHSSDARVDSTTWVDSKSWDGVEAVVAWIHEQVAVREELRVESHQRYWYLNLLRQLDTTTEQLDTTQALCLEATKAKGRHQWYERQLELLASSARSALEGVIEEAVRETALGAEPGEKVDTSKIESALGAWYDVQYNRLLELRDSVIEETAIQRERPIIKVILGSEPEVEEPSGTTDAIRTLTPQVKKVLTSIREAAEKQKVGEKSRSDKLPRKKARGALLERTFAAISIAETVVGPAGELLALLTEEANRAAAVKDRARRRQQLQNEIREGCEEAADLVYQEWNSGLEGVTGEFGEYFGTFANSSAALLAEEKRLVNLLERGRELVVSCPLGTRSARSR